VSSPITRRTQQSQLRNRQQVELRVTCIFGGNVAMNDFDINAYSSFLAGTARVGVGVDCKRGAGDETRDVGVAAGVVGVATLTLIPINRLRNGSSCAAVQEVISQNEFVLAREMM
jgi:hypothetical protein